MQTNRVLVLSDSLEDAASILHSVTKLENTATTLSSESRLLWTVDTKYYTAVLEFVFAKLREIPQDVDCAAVLVSWPSVKEDASLPLKESLLSLLEKTGPGVALCACQGSCPALSNWCLDAGFEFVDTTAVTTEEREKEGYDRIVEAFEANMWPEMKQKPRGTKHSTSASTTPIQAPDSTQPHPQPPQSPSEAPNPAEDVFKSFNASFPATVEEAAHAANKQPTMNADALLAEVLGTSGFWSDLDSSEEGLYAALSKLTKLRKEAQSLPDEARRDIAMKVALAFAQHLGGEDEDEDEGKI